VINVGVAYGSDTRQVRKLIARIADQHSCVLADPPPVVTFEGFGDSTLNFVLRCHLSNLADRLPTIHDLHEAIHERFAAAGIEIAFPQRDLRLRTPVELTRRTLPDAKDDSST
jgi:potassium efflux system protein